MISKSQINQPKKQMILSELRIMVCALITMTKRKTLLKEKLRSIAKWKPITAKIILTSKSKAFRIYFRKRSGAFTMMTLTTSFMYSWLRSLN
jgi:hypothetical protein